MIRNKMENIMTESNVSRRKFMLISSAAVGAPLVMKMTSAVSNAQAAVKEAEKQYKAMKSIVIYYSQSGNTKQIAQALQKGIIQQTGQCDIARVKEIKAEELAKYDLIGIGAPTWSSCPSPIVIYFIKSLPATLKGKHFFWYSTHGVFPGRCVIRGVQPLLDQGMTVIGWKDWYCQASLPGHGKPWFTDGHPDNIDLAEAESFGAAMVLHSRKISGGQTNIIPTLHSKEASDQIWGIGHPFLSMGGRGGEGPGARGGAGGNAPSGQAVGSAQAESKPYPLAIPTSGSYVRQIEGMGGESGSAPSGQFFENKLKINPDKCIRCKRCVKGCPQYNIDDSVFPYVYKTQNCERCMFCEGICPTGAIEFNFPKANADSGGLFSNNDQLDLAEAMGRFRRLVKEEDIGWNTPWETVTGHPRHKELP
jgi:NAD-dependent dihydropyrimidine dehydrogenase PreA subunit